MPGALLATLPIQAARGNELAPAYFGRNGRTPDLWLETVRILRTYDINVLEKGSPVLRVPAARTARHKAIGHLTLWKGVCVPLSSPPYRSTCRVYPTLRASMCRKHPPL